MEIVWNLWHGCRKVSEGCRNCYVYREDARYGKIASEIFRTKQFRLPVEIGRDGNYRVPSGSEVMTCFTSDFLLEDADDWRTEAWAMIRERKDLRFVFITKRIERFLRCIPPDWGEGWDHVSVGVTAENQQMADLRLPVFREIPARHKFIVCEPLLGQIELRSFLDNKIEQLIAGGESGEQARVCDFEWVLDLREQCLQKKVNFRFKQTGARFLKDGKCYRIRRPFQHLQARKADLDLIF